MYLGVMGECTKHFVENGDVHVESIPTLECNHAEADTRVVLHMIQSDKEATGDIVVRASDTDIGLLVLLVHHVHRVSSMVWMEIGSKGMRNLRYRYLNARKIAERLGPDICAALPGLHAFTGCDYTSAFIRHGKIKPFETAQHNEKYKRAFAELTSTSPSEETKTILQEFVCRLYGLRKNVNTSLNKHRFNVVEKTYSRRGNSTQPFQKLKSIEGSSIPPCEAELAPHIDRNAFVARLWGSAHQQRMNKVPHMGWEKVDNEFHVVWFYGEQLPPSLVPEIHVPVELDLNEASGGYSNDDDDLERRLYETDSSDESDADFSSKGNLLSCMTFTLCTCENCFSCFLDAQ